MNVVCLVFISLSCHICIYILCVNVRTQASSKQQLQQLLPVQVWKTMIPSGDHSNLFTFSQFFVFSKDHSNLSTFAQLFVFSKDKQKVAAAPPSQPAVMSPTQVS